MDVLYIYKTKGTGELRFYDHLIPVEFLPIDHHFVGLLIEGEIWEVHYQGSGGRYQWHSEHDGMEIHSGDFDGLISLAKTMLKQRRLREAL